MCRFLLVRSKKKIDAKKLLSGFSKMCENSHAPDGDWQGDGYGVAWKNDTGWKSKKSLLPIWQDHDLLSGVSDGSFLVAHARSAGFSHQKGEIAYNQPYIDEDMCFVFNGMIRGVSLTRKLDGKIGAQKIFSLIREEAINKNADSVLRLVDTMIGNNAKQVVGMNIGLVKDDKFYLLCQYQKNASYFGLRYYSDGDVTIVCSEPINGYSWKTMKKGEVLAL